MAGIDNNSGLTGIDLLEDEDWHRRVRVRAYEIWELEGHHSDRTDENWLRAEQEIVDAADIANELMLATTYREAAAGDAWHERDNTGTAQGGQDWSLAVTPEVPGVPLDDMAHPDPADGEDYSVPPSQKGPAYDALMRGFEPGETSMD